MTATIDEILAKQKEEMPKRDLLNVIAEVAPINKEERTVRVAFSSEKPVARWFGNEVLSHDVDDVDLTRLLAGAPVLVNHNMDDQVGVIESAQIDPDRVGRAVLRFGNSQRASEVFQDVIDGIRQKISFMYSVGEYSQSEDDPETFIGRKWTPAEISVVSVPADISVGVGRSLEIKETKQESITMTVEDKQPQIDVDAVRGEAVKAEQKRVADILAVGKRYNLTDQAVDFASTGKSVDEFREIAMEEMSKRQPEAPKSELDMSEKEVKSYSLMRAINALISNDWSQAGLEREASIAVADNLGKNARGFYVPFDVQTRAQNTQTLTAGGALVGTDHLGGSFIDLLRANSVVMGLGANMITAQGNIDIPKQTSASTAYWVGEGQNVTDSEATFGTVQLSPRTVGVAVPITRRMQLQSDPSIDALISNDIARVMSLAIDDAILEGDGVNKPLGITGVTGVATSTIASAGAPTWAELVEFETDVDTSNALTGNLAYVTTPAVKGTLKITTKDSGSGLFLLDGGLANGYPVATTSQLTANRIIFGNFSDVIVANFGILDIMQDKSTNVASGGTVIRAFQDLDSAVRHAESFCINA